MAYDQRLADAEKALGHLHNDVGMLTQEVNRLRDLLAALFTATWNHSRIDRDLAARVMAALNGAPPQEEGTP